MRGPHAIPNVWVDSYAVYTNVPPAGAFRGYGVSQAAWAYETQPNGVNAVRKEHQTLEAIEVSRFLHERPVPIEKHGRARHLSGYHRHSGVL